MNGRLTHHTKKVLNWRGWLVGAYLAAFPQALSKILDFFGTNGVEKTGLAIAAGTGLSPKQLGATFVISLLFNAGWYVMKNPLPETVEKPVSNPPIPL